MALPVRSTPAVIQQIADRLAPTLRRQFLTAIDALRERISLATIVRALERGELTIEMAAAVASWPQALRAAVRTLNDAFATAAQATARQLPAGLSLRTSLALTNPFAAQVADTNTALLVREVTAETRRSLQLIIARAINDGIPPRQAARLIQPLVGLTRSQAQAVLNYRARLIAQGLSGDRLMATTTRYANRLARLRAETIARTETIRASVDGQLLAWRAARADGLIAAGAMKRWSVSNDDRLCPRCAPLNGIEVPLDAAFPGGVQGPPLHPRCRCAVVLVSAASTRRRAA
jgi:SPP1 gp7 family putative phage head morphogenesis protein